MIKECDTTHIVNNGKRPLTKEEEEKAFAKIRHENSIKSLQTAVRGHRLPMLKNAHVDEKVVERK
jgi:hypothetical protein